MNFGEDLSLQVMLAHKSYQHYLSRIFNKIDIQQHCQIILLLSRLGGKSTQKHLCAELRIEKSNMVAIIDLLKKKGYVTKEVNYKDRRGKLIVLTYKATELVEELSHSFVELENNMTDELTWLEMYSCLRVLNKMNAGFKIMLNKSLTDLKKSGEGSRFLLKPDKRIA